jgi:hypothetical protein
MHQHAAEASGVFLGCQSQKLVGAAGVVAAKWLKIDPGKQNQFRQALDALFDMHQLAIGADHLLG